MLFDVNRPTTEAALAQLYTGNPNLTPQEVDSNLFLSSSQGRDYIHKQAANLGMGNDPAQYFSAQQLARTMATQQNGAQAEFARITGQYAPNSLPGQLARRDTMWQAAMDNDAKQAATLAALQTANRMKAFPLPEAGTEPQLSPVMEEDMRQRGITNPMEYILGQRLGGMASPSVASGMSLSKPVASLAGLQSRVDPEALYNEGTFQNAIGQNPQAASTVFEALTGANLGAYNKAYTDSAGRERTRGSNFLFEALTKGEAGFDEQGNLRWRKRIADPTTGKMALSPEFEVGDAFQRSQEKYLPYVDRDISKFKALAAKRGTPVAPLQMGPPTPTEVPPQLAASGQNGDLSTNLFGNFLSGSLSDVKRLLTLQGVDGSLRSGADFIAPQGRAVTHARPLLANNPQFQALARKDPAAARRIIMAIQLGGLDNSPMAETPRDDLFTGP